MYKNAQRPQQQPAPKANAKQAPAHKIKSGALSVSIWEQRTPEGCFFTCNPQRAFTRDDAKTWEHSASFTRDDLATVAALMLQAHAWICREEAKATAPAR